MTAWPRTTLRISTVLRVPRSFAFRWCTDFRSDDARREGESYERRVLEQTARRVVFEDLESTSGGWHWTRHVVTLRPPNRWHSDSVGNYRDAKLDYVLTALGPERTRFELIWKRRASALAGKPQSRSAIEKGTLQAWRQFAAEMEKDYRKARRR